MADQSFDGIGAAGTGSGGPAPDPHGHAAILLVESLIHGLIARDVISVRDAIEIVEIAADVKEELAADPGARGGASPGAAGILGMIAASLGNDLPHS